jgi:hypothetical protein
MDTQELIVYCEQAKDLIAKYFKFLEDEYQYVRSDEVSSGEMFLVVLAIVYISETRDRRVSIRFSAIDVRDGRSYAFGLSICTIAEVPGRDHFYLRTFLEMNGVNISDRMDNFNQEDADFIVWRMSRIVQLNILPVIEGTLWLDKYYVRKD